MATTIISPSEFRANQRKYFDLAHTERVIIRRNNTQSYVLLPTYNEEIEISDELRQKISKARKELQEGKGVACKTFEDSLNLLESL